jgi:uroporphyrinogen decarboxylase
MDKNSGVDLKEKWNPGVKKMRDFYAIKPDAPIYQTEFGFYVLDRWKSEGHIGPNEDLAKLFGFDPPGKYSLGNLGWCEAGFEPVFEEKVLEDQGDYELVQDFAGRTVKCFKNRRSGFMPEYMDHPVKDRRSWEEKCLWRMDPKSPERVPKIQKAIAEAKAAALEGRVIVANLVGGYMYLRSLMGPLELMYLLYDDPELVHACMQTWLNLADAVYAEMQKEVHIDEVFFGEDICYNYGLLISGEMVREFLFPYYQQLIHNIRARRADKSRPLSFQLDTDGFSDVALPLYREIGLTFLSPFEAASGCDVVRTAKEYPDLLISGGFDKRILAQGKDAIDREIDRIMPGMKKRGGYFPTCDHGVPEEVSFENYMHYRKQMLAYGK